MNSNLSGFYKDTLETRKKRLETAGVPTSTLETIMSNDVLGEVGNHLVENYLSSFETPLGIALNFKINGKERIIPMATEEPSVIAAASHAAKLTLSTGGFHASINQRLMTGQIILTVNNIDKQKEILLKNKSKIIEQLNHLRPSMVNRGGGVKEMEIECFHDMKTITLYFFIDTCDAMGANMINSLMEDITPYIEELTHGEVLLAILSNYTPKATVTAYCEIPFEILGGEEVATRIVKATQYAYEDKYRAVTHNKGIMNGVEAIIQSTGNDTRAISADIHAFACRHGRYEPLTTFSITDQHTLKGEITLPIPVGIIGGGTKVLPKAKANVELMEITSANELMEIIASVGLAQNIAALKALVTEGIQKGHMGLQAKSLAMQVGATGAFIDQVATALKHDLPMTEQKAINYLKQIQNKK